ncbi:MAG TPA: hypothetical protein VFR40_04315 [Lapillicoccus sp.]|nr:hypothetical protein [Lapillicoccus sp.]
MTEEDAANAVEAAHDAQARANAAAASAKTAHLKAAEATSGLPP